MAGTHTDHLGEHRRSGAALHGQDPAHGADMHCRPLRLDREALSAAESDTSTDADPHDRLFEAVMARLEAMAPHRTALVSIARSQG